MGSAWRAADELERVTKTPRYVCKIAQGPTLPAVNGGTMVKPGYAGRMYFLAQNGKIIALTARPVRPRKG